jgi:hypothetical protein
MPERGWYYQWLARQRHESERLWVTTRRDEPVPGFLVLVSLLASVFLVRHALSRGAGDAIFVGCIEALWNWWLWRRSTWARMGGILDFFRPWDK